MPRRNIGWGWHLASPSEIAAWQLEVNKSWSCEKWLPCLLAQSLLPLPSNTKPNNTTCCFHRVFFFYQPSNSMEWIDWVKEVSWWFCFLVFVRITCSVVIFVILTSLYSLLVPCLADAVTRKAAGTGTRRPQTPWSSTGRPRDASSSSSASVDAGWVSEGVTEGLTDRCASWAELHLRARGVGTVGESVWVAEGRLSQVPGLGGAVTTWLGFVQSQVAHSLEDHAGNTPN